MSSEHLFEASEHKKQVTKYLQTVGKELAQRAIEHDDSKFSPEEFDAFQTLPSRMRNLIYGSDEYKQALEQIGEALAHHYRENRDHPEHFLNGINDMTLIDLLEMICDWIAIAEQSEGGDIYRSLEINKNRFKIDTQLFTILKNTVDHLLSPQ